MPMNTNVTLSEEHTKQLLNYLTNPEDKWVDIIIPLEDKEYYINLKIMKDSDNVLYSNIYFKSKLGKKSQLKEFGAIRQDISLFRLYTCLFYENNKEYYYRIYLKPAHIKDRQIYDIYMNSLYTSAISNHESYIANMKLDKKESKIEQLWNLCYAFLSNPEVYLKENNLKTLELIKSKLSYYGYSEEIGSNTLLSTLSIFGDKLFSDIEKFEFYISGIMLYSIRQIEEHHLFSNDEKETISRSINKLSDGYYKYIY